VLPEDVINGISTQTGSQHSIDLGSEGCSDLKALIVILTCLFFWQICYFFYKNITFGFTLFLYEVYASFSGQPAYNDWFLSLYSVFFSSLPVIALGVLDQDVSARYCLKVSCVYHLRICLLQILKPFKWPFSNRRTFLLPLFWAQTL